ncbi:MAG TPA: class I SAM-dependent RNA methyltransferase [Nitrospiria bacterium]|nr:class I SAM-dependent RNA methyltransferase [Nitrospiria bacterium]
MTTSGERLSLTVDKVIHGGRGMGRSAGCPVFVGGTLPGERIEARVTARRKGYLEAAVERVLAPSTDRIEAPCAAYPACGGCQLQHAGYSAQLALKRALVQETLQRVGGVALDVPPLIPSPEPFGYRLRAQIKIDRRSGPPVLGFYAAGSHRVVPAPTCLVLHPRLQEALSILQGFAARDDPRLNGVREVELQTTSCADDGLIVLHGDSFRPASLRTLARDLRASAPVRGLVAYSRRGRRVEGADWLDETVDGVRCRVSDRTFLQINAGVNAALIATVAAWAALTGRERVVDLYAGFGNLSLPLARHGVVTAVESSPSAVADARWNARASGRPVHVVGQSVDEWSPKPDDRRPDLVVMDPPRSGLTRAALSRVLMLAAPRLLYVSCEPATLARDVKRLVQAGYAVRRIVGFDMFPQTAHAETVAELSKI